MSYGGDIADMFYQVGIYTGKILRGANPADARAAVDEIKVCHQLANRARPRN